MVAEGGHRIAACRILTSPITTSTPAPDGKSIYRKLNSLRLESISWSNGLPLSEVIRYLAEQSRLRDPDKKGINFMFNPDVDASTAATNAAPETVDPSTINVKLVVNDVSLHDALDAVMLVADRPIKYSVEDYAVVISPKPSGPEPPNSKCACSRWIQTHLLPPPNRQCRTVIPSPQVTGLQTNNVPPAMAKRFFAAIGVDLNAPGRSYRLQRQVGFVIRKGHTIGAGHD